jgi:hypothetical protein
MMASVGNRGADLPTEARELMPYHDETNFRVTPGQNYEVYAMAWWPRGIIILILDDLVRPHWYPIYLFKVSNSSLPACWHFGTVGDPAPRALEPMALWGYEALISDRNHHEALVYSKKDALRTFVKECFRPDLPDNERRKFEVIRGRLSGGES